MALDWNKDFYEYWDAFVKMWHKNNALPKDELTKSFVYRYLDELPEPYVGYHENAQLVVINYNPGASGEDEVGKLFSNQSDDTLIAYFRKTCKRSYSKYIRDKSPLRKTVLGVRDRSGITWWNQRMPWMERFHYSFSKRLFDKERIFALEMSPFHSLQWDGDVLNESKFDDFIVRHVREKVVVPAVATVLENRLPCVVCVGLGIGRYFEKKFKLSLIVRVSNGEVNTTGGTKRRVSNWPKYNNKLIKRTYELYKLDIGTPEWCPFFSSKYERKTIPFLILGSQGSNRLPGDNFKEVEKKEIVKRLKKMLKHSECN